MSRDNGLFSNYASDAAVSLMFGLGYFLFRSLKNKKLSWSDPKENLKNLKGKLEQSLEKWQYAKTIEEYNELIKSDYDGEKDPFEIIAVMTKTGVIPTIETYNALLYNCLVTGNIESADMLKDEILDFMGPVYPNIFTLNTIIKGLSIKYENLAIDSSKKEILNKKFDEDLVEIIQSFEKRNISLDIHSQNSILEALIKQGRLEESWNQYCNMKSVVAVDSLTSNIIIQVVKLMNAEEWVDKAVDLLEEAGNSIEIDYDILNHVIDLCIRFNKVEKAAELYQGVIENKYDNRIHITMLKGYSKMFDLEQSINCFQRISNPDTACYSLILNTCIKCKDLNQAELYVQEMTDKNIEKSLLTYSLMINGYRKTKNISRAIDLFDYIIANKSNMHHIQFDIDFFNSILEVCVEGNKYEKMNEIFQSMKESGSEMPRMNSITLSILLKGYAKSNSLSKVTELYYSLRNDLALDDSLYNTILDCYARNNDELNTLTVFNDMKSKNIKIGVLSYGILIKLYCNINNCNRAFELFDECVKNGNKPTVVIYQMLIKLQVKSKFIDRAVTLFRNMNVNQIKADSIVCELIIKACFEQERTREACEFLVDAVKEGLRIEKFLFENFITEMKSSKSVIRDIEKNQYISSILSSKSDKMDKNILNTLNEMKNIVNATTYTPRRSTYSTDTEVSLYESVSNSCVMSSKSNSPKESYRGNYRSNKNSQYNQTKRTKYSQPQYQKYQQYEERSIYA